MDCDRVRQELDRKRIVLVAGAVLVDVLLNCGNAAVKLLDLIGNAFEFILAALHILSGRDGFVDQIQHPLQLTGGNAERMALALDDADRAGRRWPAAWTGC